jgi:hypothetical protein
MVVAVPAHASTIVQAFDFVFCGALNKLMATAQGEFEDDSFTDEIIIIVRAEQHTATSITVRGSFPPAELVPYRSVRPLRLTIEEDTIRENKGFRKVSDGEIEIEEMSRKWQVRRLAIMNQQFGTG